MYGWQIHVGQCRARVWILLCTFWTRTVGIRPGSPECSVCSYLLPKDPSGKLACAGWFYGSNDLHGDQEGVLRYVSVFAHLLGICRLAL